MSRRKQNPNWTQAELLMLKNLFEIHKSEWSLISAHIPGRNANGCRDAYYSHVKGKKPRKRRRDESGASTRHSLVHQRPDDVLLEARERRRAARDLRDLTATFFGDPPPGFSALDEKRGARP